VSAAHSPDRLDLGIVARQLGRDDPESVHPVSRVMVRCPWQLPAVVEDLPYDAGGRPFPTLFYLTCPSAAAAVHRVESGGGLDDVGALLAESPELRASLQAAERYERRRRRTLAARGARRDGTAPAADGGASLATGVAGRRRDDDRSRAASGDRPAGAVPLKCLHAHVAHALARPGYALGELLVERAGGRAALWCNDARCLRLPSSRGRISASDVTTTDAATPDAATLDAATADAGTPDAGPSDADVRVAVVDLGTNTCRLLLAEVGAGRCGPVRQELRSTRVVRLGRGVDEHRRLAPEAVERTRECLAGYAARIEEYGPQAHVLIATSALRDAADGEDFLERARIDFGLPWRILSGREEAATMFRGASCGVVRPSGTLLAVDSGGGSTELVVGASAEPSFDTSLDVGAVRLTERFFQHDPPTEGEWAAAVRHVRGLLRAGVPSEVRRGVDDVVGVAGTVATLVALKLGLRDYRPEVVDGQPLHLGEIERAITLFRVLTSGQRYHLPGMQPGREDVILGGALIAREVCLAFGAPGMVYSESDILEGAALACADETRTAEKPVSC